MAKERAKKIPTDIGADENESIVNVSVMPPPTPMAIREYAPLQKCRDQEIIDLLTKIHDTLIVLERNTFRGY